MARTVEELDERIARLNEEMDARREKTKAEIRELTQERDGLLALQALDTHVAGMDDKQRAQLAQALKARSVSSGERVGDLGK
jgi:hypothetical protein